MKWVLMVSILLCSVGCFTTERFLPSTVAKQSDLDALKSRVEKVEVATKETSQFTEEVVSEVERLRMRTTVVESAVKEVERKVDPSHLNAALEAWAQKKGVATVDQFQSAFLQQQGQLGVLSQQLAGKMDKFQIQPVVPSTVIQGAVCMFFRDRITNQWWCWRWMQSSPAPTTRLLFFNPQTCQWVEMAPEAGWSTARERQLPMPPHVFQQQVPGGDEPPPIPLPAAPVPQPAGMKSRPGSVA